MKSDLELHTATEEPGDTPVSLRTEDLEWLRAMILEDIRAALTAATPGPLVAFRANPRTDDPDRREWIGVTRGIATDYAPDVFSSRNCSPADAELYANAPTWLAYLLAEVDRLQEVAS